MALPARLRVNAAFPFPALVQGSGPITVAKSNGTWTLGYTIDGMAQSPSPGPNDLILLWDANLHNFYKTSLNTLGGGTAAGGQRSVTLAANLAAGASDQILNCNITTGSTGSPNTVALPSAASRAGLPISYIDVGGQALAHPIQISRAGSDVILSANGSGTSITLSLNYQRLTFMPFTDGVNIGWYVS